MSASGHPTADAVAAASARSGITYKCCQGTLDTASSTSRTHGLDVQERLSRTMCGQLSRKKLGGNSTNHTTRFSGIPGRPPFQEITNVADSHSLTKMKQGKNILDSVDHQVTGKKRSLNTSSLSIHSSASEHKRYHDRERYLQMTPEQHGAYLQRNREYKWRKKNLGAVSDNTQSATSQTCTSTVGNVHTTTLPTTSTEVATVEISSFSPSYSILKDDIISPVTENHTMTSPSDISTPCNECVITAQNKRIAEFLDKGGEHKRRRISHGASCDYTVKETHEHVAAKEQKDHDNTIYVPSGYFPAIEDESGQTEDMTEDDDGDDEGYIFTRQESAGGKVIDEIREYRDARFISPPEAIWRIYSFNLSEISPPVLQLQVYLPNMHTVRYKDSDSLDNVISKESSSKTMLTEYFRMNSIDSYARNFLYKEFPEHYIWQKNKTWKRRRKRIQIRRLVAAHPAEGERYYLRILLNHVRGATSFDDLRTVEGVVLSTFREAAERRGLIEADNSISECLIEASTFQMPYALRRLFATVLAFCEVSHVRSLWDKHFEAMSDDFRMESISSEEIEQRVLRDIGDLLYSMGKDIRSFDLPDLLDADELESLEQRELADEMSISVDREDLQLCETLNNEQRLAFDEIMNHVFQKKGKVFFIDGPGGTRKTYLYKALLAKVRSTGLIAIATATSGIAASIMPGGRTAHSRFKIPINIQEDTVCNFSKQSGTAELLRRSTLIIWDEVAMTKRQAVEALDRTLQDIMGCTSPFGGKIIVFGGDLRQVLPVVRRGTRAQIINATLKKSYLWEDMIQIKLQHNMRAKSDPWFSDFLLRIGNGTEESIGEDYVRLPEEVVIGYTKSKAAVTKLINDVFPSLSDNGRSSSYISSRAILSTKNEYVDELNEMLIEQFPGEEKIYYSFDSAVDDTHNHYPPEYLNYLSPNGLPPHVLRLKINCPVILLRNLDPSNGLCNGTRLINKAFQGNVIDAEIIGGQHSGKRVFLPRIPLYPSEDDVLPFKFTRKQFPIRLSFAMTINKAQGQTIPSVGIYLPEPVFSHG